MSTATATQEKKVEAPKTDAGSNGKPPSEGFQRIALDHLKPNPNQPRKDWAEEAEQKDAEGKTDLDRLAESIKEEGILQPLIVAPDKDGKFTIVCGERRFKAAQKVGLKDAPCIVHLDLSESDMLELALTENIQRRSLKPVDEARAFKALMDKCGYTMKALAKKLGVSGASITYKLSLLGLTPELQKAVNTGAMTPTDARFVGQEVNRITGPNKDEHKREVMNRVADTVKTAANNGQKLTSKAVQAVAKQEVARQEEQRSKPTEAPKASTPKGKPKEEPKPTTPPAPPKPKQPSPAEKKQRAEFLKAVDRVKGAFKKYEPLLVDQGKLARFAQVLVLCDLKVDEQLYAALKVVGKVYENVATQKRVVQIANR
jgi:ParB/RepB/Spo0J family partition protein